MPIPVEDCRQVAEYVSSEQLEFAVKLGINTVEPHGSAMRGDIVNTSMATAKIAIARKYL